MSTMATPTPTTCYRPRRLAPCDCASDTDRVTRTTDGLTDTYHCAACAQFLAELVVGPEP